MAWIQRYSAARLLIGALAIWISAATPAQAADPSKADVQWAQTALKQRGFYQGRENGDFNDQTRAALNAFQKKNGLPATGRLDPATVAKLMEGRTPSATMGNLAAPPKEGAKSKAQASAPAPRPVAAPSQRVDADGEAAETVVGAVGGTTAPGAESSPVSAPRAAVTLETPDGSPVSAGEPFDLGGLLVPGWVRSAIAGTLGATVLAALAAWWLSGRRAGKKRRPVRVMGDMLDRREPTLGERRGADLRAEPPLRAGRF